MSAKIIKFIKEKDDHKCNFCGTPKSKAKKMISNSNNGKHICDKCILHAMKRVEEEN